MDKEFYYRGLYKVKVLTESEGYWIVQAEENFSDTVDGEKIDVKIGETRIVERKDLHDHKILAPTIPEHAYELKMEKKVKKMVENYENKEK
jgi:hypothetical protein